MQKKIYRNKGRFRNCSHDSIWSVNCQKKRFYTFFTTIYRKTFQKTVPDLYSYFDVISRIFIKLGQLLIYLLNWSCTRRLRCSRDVQTTNSPYITSCLIHLIDQASQKPTPAWSIWLFSSWSTSFTYIKGGFHYRIN